MGNAGWLIIASLAFVQTPSMAAMMSIETLAGYHDIAFLIDNDSTTIYHSGDGGTFTSNSLTDGILFSKTTETITPNTTATAYGSINAATGQIKSSMSTDSEDTRGVLPPNDQSDSFGYSNVTLSENMLVSGSGTITAIMTYDGFWQLDPVDETFSPSFQISGLLNFGPLFAGDVDLFHFDQTSTEPIGSASGDLIATIEASEGAILNLTAGLLTQVVSGKGLIDFSNTATLSLITSPGVSLTFDDSRFLSTPLSTVPVPPGLPLLLSSLAVLGLVRARQRNRWYRMSKVEPKMVG